jgi:hypothetical protein
MAQQKKNKPAILTTTTAPITTTTTTSAARLASALDTLYPITGTDTFNAEIAKRVEFSENFKPARDDGDGDISFEEKIQAAEKAPFSLKPYQKFVRNFLSVETPYNSLLLFHGLGTGKTCTAVSVAEEMKDYMQAMEQPLKKIIVVGGPHVVENFKNTLFNSNKDVDAQCIGNKYKEEALAKYPNTKRDDLPSVVNQIINQYYEFYGYIAFANLICKQAGQYTALYKEDEDDEKRPKSKKKQKERVHCDDTHLVNVASLRAYFANRLIIVDEVQNMKGDSTSSDKKVVQQFAKLIDNHIPMRLLFLSATPVYNSVREIIDILNYMNQNDDHDPISYKDIFTKDNELTEAGAQILQSKAYGYVSFVQGGNPYTFPYRVWPSEFAPFKTFNEFQSYPTTMMKQKVRGGDVQILDPIENFAVYLVTPSATQEDVYKKILLAMGKVFICEVFINGILLREIRISAENEKEAKTKAAKKFIGQKNVKIKCRAEDAEDADVTEDAEDADIVDAEITEGSAGEEEDEDTETSFNFTKLDKPLEALNIIYPETAADAGNVKNRIGKNGLLSVMKLDKNGVYTYKKNINFFTPEILPDYSCKITSICEHIEKSTGIVLVYSRWLPAGAIPLALALEERGFSRYKKANLLQSKSKNKSESKSNQKNYIFISGVSPYIPNPDGQDAIDLCNSLQNKNGELIKVIIITQAGAEGLDFKFIRQVHIMEPWHNLSRIEQTIGRAVRQKSHDALPFAQKNVELYLYGTLLAGNPTEEAADLYMYRKALRNAKLIGQVTRLLKETSVDCLLNVDLPKFSAEDMPVVIQETASGESLQTQFGYKPYSAACDYMQNCEYTCKPTDLHPGTVNDAYMASYTEPYLRMNIDIVQAKIRGLMRERYFYTTADILRNFHMLSSTQIFAGLQQMITLETPIQDKYNRSGTLIQIGDMYFFQPLELRNTQISMHDRMTPLEVKPEKVRVYKEYIPQSREEAEYENDNVQDEVAYKFNLVFHNKSDEKHKQDAWYTNCAKVMNVLMDAGITENTLLNLKAAVMGHILDEVSVDTLIEIFNTRENIQDKDLRTAIHRYFKNSRYVDINDSKEKEKAYFITKDKANNELRVLRFTKSTTEREERLEEAPSELEKIITAFKNKLKQQVKQQETLKQAVIGFTLKDILKTILIRKFFVSRIKGATCSKGDITIDADVLPLPEGEIKTEKDICVILELRLRLKDMAARAAHTMQMFYFLSPAESDILLQLKTEEQNKAKKNEAAEKKKFKSTLKIKKITQLQNTLQNKTKKTNKKNQ